MNNLEQRVENFLLDNTDLIDKLFILKINLKIKKILRLSTPTNDLDTFIWEIKYLIEKQKGDRDDVLVLRDYVALLEKNGETEKILPLRQKLSLYIEELQRGLIINEIYIDDVNASIKQYQDNEISPNITFDDVLKVRENINNKHLVLIKKNERKIKWNNK